MIGSTGAVNSGLLMHSPGGGGWGIPQKSSGNSGAAIPGWGQAPGKKMSAGLSPGGNAQTINYSAFGTIKPPQYMSDANTQSAVNSQLAQGDQAADLRGLRKQYMQAGRSLGRGENFHASVESAAKQQGARADAANTEMGDALNNSKMRTDYEYAREMEGQKLAGLQQLLGQADWARNFGLSQNAAQQLAARQQAMLTVLGPLFDIFSQQNG